MAQAARGTTTDDAQPAPFRAGWIEGLAAFALGFGLMQALYAGSVAHAGDAIGAPETDSFYHITMAEMLPQVGILREFPWLQFVWFSDQGHEFVSHHFGFHVLLWPFVTLARCVGGEPLAGGRWAMAFFMGLNFLLFQRILRQRGVPLRWLWLLLLLFMPDQFFARHGFVRAIGPSLTFLLLLLQFLFAGRIVWTAVVVAAYIHLYLGAVLYGPLIVATHTFAMLITGRIRRWAAWRMAGITALGWLVGVLTYPYAGGMYEFLRLQVFGSGLTPTIEVGREWRPYGDSWFLLHLGGPVLVLWVVALLARLRLGRALDAPEATLLVLQTIFLMLTCRARRFIEYWPILSLLSAACLAGPALRECLSVRARARELRARWLWKRLAGSAGLIAILLYAAPWARAGLRSASQQLRCRYDLPALRAALQALADDSAPGDVVFTDDWDVFPVFFYLNRKNYYVVGLDPEFTHHRDPQLWERYVRISRGEVPAPRTVEPANGPATITLADIRTQFHARYVVTDRSHRRLAEALASAPATAQLIYPDNDYRNVRAAPYLVFRLRTAAECDIAAQPRTPQSSRGAVFLSDLTPVAAEQGWGQLGIDQSVGGQPLRAGGVEYAHGLGTHAAARLEFDIPIGAERFAGRIAIDDETLGRGAITAAVILDERQVFESGRILGDDPPVEFNIPLKHARRLVLRIDATPDGMRFDHADWLEARFLEYAPSDEPIVGLGAAP